MGDRLQSVKPSQYTTNH